MSYQLLAAEVQKHMGFRKIDADKWEFANESFLRGKRHLLKNIQRRKSPQSQQVGSSVGSSPEVGKSAVESEIERLKKQRNLMMQEVIELQQKQHGTTQHMEAVKEKLQDAEQRQKQMVSFLAKVIQNPEFLNRLQPKDHMTIASPRTVRKFVKHQQHELGIMSSSVEGQIVKYDADLENLAAPSLNPESNPIAVEKNVEATVENLGLDAESMPFPVENIVSDDLAGALELLKPLEEVREGISGLGAEDPFLKGKNVVSPKPEAIPEYVVSFPDDLGKGKSFPDLLSSGFENIVGGDEEWSIGFETAAGMSSSNTALWDNISNFNVSELGASGGLSDIWDLGSSGVAGGSGIETWPADESPFNELDRLTSQHIDDSSKKMDP